MKIAITGGTGFVGRNMARQFAAKGHSVVLIARGHNRTDPTIHELPTSCFVPSDLRDVNTLADAFAGCEAVVHCAGINRELGSQTYRPVHIEGTRNVVAAAQRAGVRKMVLISFLRARPNCGSAYHESKWAAEEIVRSSGLDYTILKCGVIYGQGDHMLDHLSHALYTFPVFALVGFKSQLIRPNAVEDVVRIVEASVLHGALSKQTVAVLGPEQLALRDAVLRVANVLGRHPAMFPMPVWFHYLMGWCVERLMTVPMASVAQVRMLAEGLAEPSPPFDPMPSELAPTIPFSKEQIRKGLPAPGPFHWHDLRCCRGGGSTKRSHTKRVFLEMP